MTAPQIVIVYRGLGDAPIEEPILAQVNAQISFVDDLDAPEVRTADALMVTTQQVTAAIIARLERCKIISRVGVGLDNVDIPAATARGIWVTNVPDYCIEEVSMQAIAMLLAHLRRITRRWRARRGRGSGMGRGRARCAAPAA